MKKKVFAFMICFVFWLILIPETTMQEIIAGLIVAGIVVYFNRYILFDKDEFPLYALKGLFIFLCYIPIIVKEIFLASVDLAKIVLSEKMEISPGFYRIPLKLRRDYAKTLYGISVNLTPGTLTVDANEDGFLIHALTEDSGMSMYEPNSIQKYSEKLDRKDM